MERHERVSAITQSLPGLEFFLKDVLANETLSAEADKQRKEFIRKLEVLSQPPSLPPRPRHLALNRKRSKNHYDRRSKLHNSHYSGSSTSVSQESPYKNDTKVDPVEFASKQRELARNITLYKNYGTRKDVLEDLGNRSDNFESTISENLPGSKSQRSSIRSSSSCEDDIYERLNSTTPLQSPFDKEAGQKLAEPFVFGSPPVGGETSATVGSRATSGRGSGGKGKLIYGTGWFKKETKVYEEVLPSSLQDATIQGWLKEVKGNKRRLCIIKDHHFYIFKNQEEPAIQILNLPECEIAVDDKKKISYSFRLTPHGGNPVALAIEEGHDLSPWMSTIMAAVVRKSMYRPTSPIEGAVDLEEAQQRAALSPCQVEVKVDETQDRVDPETPYELPVDFGYDNWLLSSPPVSMPSPVHSTPKGRKEEMDDVAVDRYDAPLPPIPTDTVDGESSSSESSSDEEEEEKGNEPEKDLPAVRNLRNSKVLETKLDLSQNLLMEGNKRDSLYDTQSEHSNWQSCSEPLASDDTGSSDQRLHDVAQDSIIRSDSVSSRKRTSTVLSSRSMDSLGSDLDLTTAPESSPNKKASKSIQPPKGKKRRKLTSAESEKQFLQDESAAHSGKLYQKRRLGVWTKRYCKIVDNCLKCYRHPDDEKPCIDFPLLGYDITLIDSKESKKGYAFKISHPNMEALYFATDSRNSVERWIEMLSLAATGQLENAAPYLPLFSSGADASIGHSQESLISSEDALERESLDDINNSQGSPQLQPKHGEPYDDVSEFAAADECEDDASSDASGPRTSNNRSLLIRKLYYELLREAPQLKDRNHHKQFSQQSSTESRGSDNLLKRNRDTTAYKESHSGCETPGTMSPPHSVFISESSETSNRHPAQSDERSKEEQKKEKEKKGWAEALKLKRSTLGRRASMEQMKDRCSAPDLQTSSKYKQNTIKKSGHSFAHLLTLFDREGKFSGFLTEIKTGKFSTTHLRWWCVVRNGVLHMYKREMEDNPISRLSLVDMFLTEDVDEEKRKFAFQLYDKEEKTHAFQTNGKEDFQKWMGVLKLFTDLRSSPEKAQQGHAALKKLDSGICSDDGSFERSTIRSKSARYSYDRGKKEDSSQSPPGKRQSLKTKFSQRVNVREIFRKSHSSYDMSDILQGDENASSSSDVTTVAYKGGILTELNVSEESYVRNIKRWCTVKGNLFLVYTDHKACDPVRQIPLDHAWVIDNSDPAHKVYRFQITIKNEQFNFLAADQADLNRWLKNLEEAVSEPSENKHTTKCMVRIPSPGIKLHRRTQSENFAHEKPESEQSTGSVVGPLPTAEKWSSFGSFRSSAGSDHLTDALMSCYLQEMHEKNGGVTLLRRWCVATSEKFLVYYNKESDKPLKSWDLANMQVEDDSNNPSTDLFGFCVRHKGKVNCFQHVDQEVIKQWLSVFARYCHSSKEFDNTTNQLPRQRYKKSASDNDIKVDKDHKKLFRVFSEGRASGAKLVQKISDDGLFPLRKFSRPEMLRTSFKSVEKSEVKLRDKSTLSSYEADRRFSSGSLFDSDGKFSSFLMELSGNDKCRSQVRRWCVLQDDFMLVYDFENQREPKKVIPLENAKVSKQVDYESGVYLLNILYSEDERANFRAMSRTDLEKWTTVISVKNAVIRSRSERDLRRQSRESTPRITEQAPSTTDLWTNSGASNSPETERNLLYPRGTPSSLTSAESTEWRLKSNSLSSITPSEDSVFAAESRVEEVGIGAGLRSAGWKIQPSLVSSEGSADDEAPSDHNKGLYPGESLKDFVNLVLSSSEEVTRNPESVNAVEPLSTEGTLQTQSGADKSICSCDNRTEKNRAQSKTCCNEVDTKHDVKCLELKLQNESTKADYLSPSREITEEFQKINLRERSASDASTQDTYFGPQSPNRNSLESIAVTPDRLAPGGKDAIARWLEDLTDNVTRNTCFRTTKNQFIENVRGIEQLNECSIKDEVESSDFEPSGKPVCSKSKKNGFESSEKGSVGCFLEEIVNSVARDFAKAMSLRVKSPERLHVDDLPSDKSDWQDIRNVPVEVAEVAAESAEYPDAQAHNSFNNFADTSKSGVDDLKTEVNIVSLQNSDFTSSSCEITSKKSGTDGTLYGGTVTDCQNRLSSSCEVDDQGSIVQNGLLGAHKEGEVIFCKDLCESVVKGEVDSEGKECSILERSETEQEFAPETTKQLVLKSNESSTESVDQLAEREDSTTDEVTRCSSAESEFSNQILLKESSKSEGTMSKIDFIARDTVEKIDSNDKPSNNCDLCPSKAEGTPCVALSPVMPNSAEDVDQQSSSGAGTTQGTLTREQLTRSQTDIINAVSEAFQGIVDIVSDSESEAEETKL